MLHDHRCCDDETYQQPHPYGYAMGHKYECLSLFHFIQSIGMYRGFVYGEGHQYDCCSSPKHRSKNRANVT